MRVRMSQSQALERLVGSAWLRCAGVICMIAIAILSLMPGESRPRTELPSPLEHFMAYCISSAMITMGARSGRFPGTIVVALVLYSGLMEALQYWAPGRDPALIGFVGSSFGASTGALLAYAARRRIGTV